jgi:hypothetical protein
VVGIDRNWVRRMAGLAMKYYLYTLFKDLGLDNTVDHYVIKYGSDAAIRDHLSGNERFHPTGYQLDYKSYGQMKIVRPTLKKGVVEN